MPTKMKEMNFWEVTIQYKRFTNVDEAVRNGSWVIEYLRPTLHKPEHFITHSTL